MPNRGPRFQEFLKRRLSPAWNLVGRVHQPLTGSKLSIAFQPLPSDDPVQRQPDITLARTHLDWAPRVDLEEGLMKTIAYFEKLLVA